MKVSLFRGLMSRYWKIFLSVFLISALCCGFMCGMLNVYTSLTTTFEKYLEEYGIPDASIATEVLTEEELRKLEALPEIAEAEARLSVQSHFFSPSGQLLNAYVSSLSGASMHRLFVWEGEINGEGVCLERRFALDNGIHSGQEIRIWNGETYRTVKVSALVSTPETMQGVHLGAFEGYYSEFGYIYVPSGMIVRESSEKLESMTAELSEQEQRWQEADSEARETLAQGQAELDEAREELKTQGENFEKAKEELQEQLSVLTQLRMQLMLGKKQLTDTDATVQAQKPAVEQALEEMQAQRLALEDRQAEVEEICLMLSSLLRRTESARDSLLQARRQITSSSDSLRNSVWLLKQAQTAWSAARLAGEQIQLPEWVSEAVGELPEMTVAEVESALAKNNVTPEHLDGLIAQAEDGLTQMSDGDQRIQAALVEINRDYLPELQGRLDAAEQSLTLIKAARELLTTEIQSMEKTLSGMDAFQEEYPRNLDDVNGNLEEVESGIWQIFDSLSEGEETLTEGQQQLEEKQAEADSAWQQAEEELQAMAGSLADAREEIASWPGYQAMRNDFYLRFTPETEDRQAALQRACEALGKKVLSAELYEDSSVAYMVFLQTAAFDVLAHALPVVFTVLVLMVLFLFLSLMVRQSRREIGVLRALGFSRGQVRGLFCLSSLLVMLPALGVGCLLSFPFRNLLNGELAEALTLPVYYPSFDVRGFLLTSFLLLGAGQLATLLSTWIISRVQPSESMTRQGSAGRHAPRKQGRVSGTLPPFVRYSLASLGRNKIRFFSAVLCIGAAISIMLTGLNLRASYRDVVVELFDRRIHYNCLVFFSEAPSAELENEVRSMAGIRDLEEVSCFSGELTAGARSESVSAMVFDKSLRQLTVLDLDGRPQEVPESGLLLPEGVAERLGIKTGDTVTLGGVSIRVAGLSRQALNMTVFLSSDQARDLQGTWNPCWLVSVEDGAEQQLMNRLNGEEGYLITVVMRYMKDSITQSMTQYMVYAWAAIAFSVLLGMFVIMNINQTNLLEQKRELSILRAMGFQRREISIHWYLHAVLYFLGSAALGLALGGWITKTTLHMLSNRGQLLRYQPGVLQIGATLGILFAFLTVAHLWSMHSLKKWNLMENIRDRE